MTKRLFFLFAGLSVLFFGIYGCGDSSSQENEGSSVKGQKPLIYGRGSDSPTLDPHDTSDGESAKVIEQMFETLVTFPEKAGGEIQPQLAREWKWNDAGDVCTFQLRKGITFHDGSPFNAKAVKVNFDRILRPGKHRIKAPYASFYKNIKRVEVSGSHTVKFHLKNTSAVFLRNVAMFAASIISPKALEKHGNELGSHPVGTGPFQFRSWSRGEKIVLERYRGYWGEPAASKNVIFLPIKEHHTRLQKLKKEEVDIIDNINVTLIEQIKNDPDLRLHRKSGMNFGYFAMNTTRDMLTNPKVRKAIALAINKEEILDVVYNNIADPATAALPPTIWAHNNDLSPYGYNPEKAKKLLQSADVNTDQSLTFLHMTNSRPYMPEPSEIARLIKRDLDKIGFSNVSLEPKPWNKYIQLIEKGEHDFCLLGWTTDNGDPDNFLGALFHSKNAVKGSALNVSFFRNDSYDRIVDQAKRTLDREKRKKLYHRAQNILHDQVPVLPIAYMPVLSASRKEVKDFEVYSIGMRRLWDPYLDTAP